MKSSDQISWLIDLYIRDHPDFEPLEDKYMHPSVLALHGDIMPWLVKHFSDPVEFWTVLLDAAKEWFPDKNKTKLGHLFCLRFECTDLTCWNGWKPIQPVVQSYAEWRGFKYIGENDHQDDEQSKP